MTGVGDARVEAAMRAALREGPRDVVQLLDAVRERAAGLVGRHEGVLHAILRRALREGRLHVVSYTTAGFARYGLEPAAAPPVTPSAPDSAPWTAKVARVVRRMERAVRDPAERVRVRGDVLAHLASLERGWGAEDLFGAPKAAAHVLKRADRGRAFVATAAGGSDHVARFVLNEGPWIAGAIVAFFVVRWFLLGVYVIPSESMVPTLRVGDRVVAWLPGGSARAKRWDIVTFDVGKTTFVKRLVGLPGESIAIVDGDVWVDGKILVKPDDVREALRFPYARGDLLPGNWEVTEGLRRWIGPRDLPRVGNPGSPPQDVYLDLDLVRSPSATVTLSLLRGRGSGSHVWWTLEALPTGWRLAEHGAVSGPVVVLATSDVPAPAEMRMSLSYVDGVLRASGPGLSWRGERAAPRGVAECEIALSGQVGSVHVSIDRDIHYSYDWTLAVPQPGGSRDPKDYAIKIPAGRVFMLGDNTTSSSDSRNPQTMGPVPIDEIHGPVRFRIWPPSRIGPVR